MKNDFDPFDAELRAALAARPEPVLAGSFARGVIRAARVRRKSPVPAVASAVAALAMLAAVLFGWARFAALQAAYGTVSTTTADTSTTTDGVVTLLLIGCVTFVAALAYLAVRGSFTRENDDPFAAVLT